MPFTLAHPAAVLPLRKKLLLSALVVGSMAPDFHYFIYFAPDAEVSHTLPNTFLYSLPVGLALLWVFHRFMKRPIISLLPESQVQKLVAFAGPFPFLPASRMLLILASFIAGILTHLFWDSFTHGQGWMVLHFPALQTIVLNSTRFQRPFYNVLQHLSSVLGMLLIVLFYARWLRKAAAQPLPADMQMNPAQRRWVAIAMTASILGLSLAYAWQRYTIYYRFPHFVGGFLIAMISVTFVDLALFSAWWWRARRLSTTD